MAGHSKFKNIMHRKNAQDRKRAKVFARHVRAISIAARENPDIETNIKLKNAISAAKADNVPKDNIERAIKKGDDIVGLEEMRYEGYGPSGLAVIIEALTNNKNRTAKELRTIFSRNDGNLAETGSVSFMFNHCGLFLYPKTVGDFSSFVEQCLETDIIDCIENEDTYKVITSVVNFGSVQKFLDLKFGDPLKASLAWLPNTVIEPEDDDLEKIANFLDVLDDNDDVQEVFFNLSE